MLSVETFKGLTNNTMVKIHKERKCLRDERTKPICQKTLVGLFIVHVCNETSSAFNYEQRFYSSFEIMFEGLSSY